MHTIGLDTRYPTEFGFAHLKRRVEIYERVRVEMIINQADKPKFLEVMESWKTLLGMALMKLKHVGNF